MTDAVWNIKQILEWTTRRFKELEFATPLLDAQLLLCSVLNVNKVYLYTHSDAPVGHPERAKLKELVKRRMQGEPVAYLLEQKFWHDLDLFVDKRVLIPRPETETLFDFVLGLREQSSFRPNVIFDFCTGSGCLAIAAARSFPEATVIGIDISEEALDVARQNAARNGAKVSFEKIDVTQADQLSSLIKNYGTPELILANPPYVTEEEWRELDIGVAKFEPKIALTAEDDGCAVAVSLLTYFKSNNLLNENSVMAMELAHRQPLAVLERVGENAFEKSFSYNSNLVDLKRDSFVVIKDVEQKERFLGWVGSHATLSKPFPNDEVALQEQGLNTSDESSFENV